MSRTSEYVSLGHPDKIADYISEYILDKLISIDPKTRYALEVQIKSEYVSLAGEVSTIADVVEGDYQHWVKEAVNNIGYTKEYQNKWGKENTICGDDLSIICNFSQQSPDIAQGVDKNNVGDQGVFAGYAENNKYTNYMPLDYYLAKDLCVKLYENAKNNNVGGLDIKTQITLSDDNEIQQLIVAIPVLDDEEYEQVKHFIVDWLSNENVDVMKFIEDEKLIINGTGKYQIHGPVGDSGTTGRKLVVDLYGLNCPIGGGALVTKDATKADLTLNLYCRQKALNGLKEYILNNGLNAHHSIFKTCCCIGQPKLISCLKIYDEEENVIYKKEETEYINLNEIIKKYGLREPVFKNLCKYGYFGNNYKWEE